MNQPSRAQYCRLPDDNPPMTDESQSVYSKRYLEHMRFSRNPDQFFMDIYTYHQSGGFWSVLLAELLWGLKLIFVVFVSIELTACTRWEVLANHTVTVHTWSDMFIPPNQCWASLPVVPSLVVTGVILGLIVSLFQTIRRLQRFWETRLYCTYVLNMPSSSTGLADLTWSEVQHRLIESYPQPSGTLDELAIYNRILRHENYLIAMVDQDILPIRFKSQQPYTHIYLPDSYLYNLRLILFSTPWSPFAQHWQLQQDYKDITRRHELAIKLSNLSRILGLLNLLCAPIILLGQLFIFVCSNAERIRYHPSSIVGRKWSNYATLYLRHYNELQHQFSVRIGLAYRPACQYLDCFISRNLMAIAEAGAFILGTTSVAFGVMGLIHEQTMRLPGYWALVVLGGLLARACLSYIPEEHEIYSPQTLLITILGKIHRFRDHWIEQGSTSYVRDEFVQLFQYRLCAMMEDLCSALLTPLLLIFVVPKHTLEMVDFLRNYTVELKEIGDVCSFAQLDIRRHGDPHWKFGNSDVDVSSGGVAERADTQDHQPQSMATWGKTELSLMHFHLNNPTYNLPAHSRAYLTSIKNQLLKDMQQQFASTSPNQQRAPITDAGSPTGLLSSLYGRTSLRPGSVSPPLSTVPGIFNLNKHFKNVSHLPGPPYVDGTNMGFIGTMVESMRNSMHLSDPGVRSTTLSDSATPKRSSTPSGLTETAGDAANRIVGDSSAYPTMKIPSVKPATFGYNTDAINVSMMAASTILSGEHSGVPSYLPYTSQIENGSSLSQWGPQSASFSRYGLTDIMTADTSASIIYMHELAQRRRNQQFSVGPSSAGPSHSFTGPVQQRGLGFPVHSHLRPGAIMPYQLGGTLMGTSRSISRSTTIERGSYGATNEFDPNQTIVDEVSEDEDELSRTPRLNAEIGFRPVSVSGAPYTFPSSIASAGIVAIPGSPSTALRPHHPISPTGITPINTDALLSGDPDPDHKWPDLPPTNC